MKRLITAAALAGLLTLLSVTGTAANPSIDSATNNLRASVGMPALGTWAPLEAAARTRAAETSVVWAHPSDWQHVFDMLPSCVTGIGENIAYSTTSAYSTSWVVNAWWNSPEHHANMVGIWDWTASATTVAGDKTYAVQLFAKGCTSGTIMDSQAPRAKPAVPATTGIPDTAMAAPQP